MGLFDKPIKHTVGDGTGAAQRQASSHQLHQMLAEFKRFNTREARVAFADSWLRTCASYFDDMWPVTYQLLQLVEEEKLYSDPRRVGQYTETYPDFKSYFEARLKRPISTWFELEQTHHYVSKYAPELIEATFPEAQAARAAAMQAADDADRAQQRPAHRPAKAETVDNTFSDINTSERPAGTSVAYALRKLRADRPDIHARVLAGEITAHAGMIEAGFRKKRKRKPRIRRCPQCGHEW